MLNVRFTHIFIVKQNWEPLTLLQAEEGCMYPKDV